MARRRRTDVFTLAFLDAMTCGLGAVILLYMILNASAGRSRDDAFLDRKAEAVKLEVEVLEGHENLYRIIFRKKYRVIYQVDAGAEKVSNLRAGKRADIYQWVERQNLP